MGIVLLPLLLIMLLGFFYVGARSGVHVVLKSQRRLTAISVLTAMSVALATADITLPFAIVASDSVSAGGFAIVVTLSVAVTAGFAGTFFRERYRSMARPIYGLCSAAFFLSGSVFPIMWFSLAERMSILFKVNWIY